MFKLKGKDIIDVLSNLSVNLGGDFTKDFSCASLKLDNTIAKGSITAYELFPGLASLIFDIKFRDEVILSADESAMNTLYFIFCLKGNIEHKFADESDFRQINFQQNVILATSNKNNNIFKFQKDQEIEASFIYLLRESTELDDSKAKYIRGGLENLMTAIGDIKTYKFFGHVRPKTAKYVDRIIHNDKKGIVARLLVEASILSILALQIEYHDEETTSPSINAPIKQSELVKILTICEEIAETLDQPWTVEKIVEETRLNSKKLQSGFRYLFNMSANTYIKNVRLETALELLQTTDLSISEVVYKIGLSSRSYFSRIFKARYGYMPSEYKNLLKSMQIELLQ